MTKTKQLILFNGRGHGRKYGRDYHFYIAAYSYADAGRLLSQATGIETNWYRELKDYYSKNCWGNPMKGIIPERGLWVCKEAFGEKPIKVC